MRQITTLLSIFYVFLWQQVGAQCGSNILTNPSFETPVQPSIGNNLTGLSSWGGWTMTGGPFNVIRTNGSAYGGGPDTAQNGSQYVDITSAGGTIYQDFVVSGSTVPVLFGGYFSSREQGGYINWTASIEIVDLGTNAVISTSNTRLFTIADGAIPAQENWYYLSGNTTLAPGNYRYRVTLGNYGNFDAGIVSLNCLLSTRISSFSGSLKNSARLLKWNCDPSNDMAYFEVERSTDGRQFVKIANVTYTSQTAYQFLDNEILQNAKVFYRLKSVDKDGAFKYSTIIFIQTKGNLALQISPNPVQQQLRVNGLQGNGVLHIYELSGKRLFTQTVSQSQTQVIDIATFNNGIYLLEYFDGETSSFKKFVKQ